MWPPKYTPLLSGGLMGGVVLCLLESLFLLYGRVPPLGRGFVDGDRRRVGTILGPFLGSIVILIIRNYVSAHIMQWATVMGVVFILTVLYAPKGLMGLIGRRPSPGIPPPATGVPKK
jgi:hypothetical protein